MWCIVVLYFIVWYVAWILLTEHSNGMTVNNKLSILHPHLALVLPMGRVILEQVYHVVNRYEGVIDCNDICILCQCRPQNKATNSPKPIDSNSRHICLDMNDLPAI